jgi:hypothetical protein
MSKGFCRSRSLGSAYQLMVSFVVNSAYINPGFARKGFSLRIFGLAKTKIRRLKPTLLKSVTNRVRFYFLPILGRGRLGALCRRPPMRFARSFTECARLLPRSFSLRHAEFASASLTPAVESRFAMNA